MSSQDFDTARDWTPERRSSWEAKDDIRRQVRAFDRRRWIGDAEFRSQG